MCESVELWGEFTDDEEKIKYDYTTIINFAKNPKCLTEYLNILPDYTGQQKNVKQLIQLSSMDPRICYTISLHQYSRDISDLIRQKVDVIAPIPLPIPSMPEIPSKCPERNLFGYLPKASSEFSLGKHFDTPKLDEHIISHLLKLSVVTLFAHIGFESAYESTLDTMADVLDEYLKKICTQLRHANDISNMSLSTGFPDVLERVFAEIGVGSILSIHDYYTNKVIKYQNIVYNQCEQLLQEYEQLGNDSVPDNVPVLHLTDDGNDLQSELQMLDFIEQADDYSHILN